MEHRQQPDAPSPQPIRPVSVSTRTSKQFIVAGIWWVGAATADAAALPCVMVPVVSVFATSSGVADAGGFVADEAACKQGALAAAILESVLVVPAWSVRESAWSPYA